MRFIMGNVALDEETLYYQYLINNNSTSTMLNAISGNSSDSSSFDVLSSLSSLSSLDSTSSLSSFSSILQNYLTGINTSSYEDTIQASTMADKLSSVLEEAKETEDTSSLTYQTVQELYEYFSEQVSAKAAALTGTTQSQSDSTSTSTTTAASASSTIDEMNQAALQREEFDFSEIDDVVDSVFTEQTPWA